MSVNTDNTENANPYFQINGPPTSQTPNVLQTFFNRILTPCLGETSKNLSLLRGVLNVFLRAEKLSHN